MTHSAPSMNPSLHPFFGPDGRTVIVPIDHGSAIPVPGMEKPVELIRSLRNDADGFVVNYGLAKAAHRELRETGICLRVDIYKPAEPGHRDFGATMLYGAEAAKAAGAHAVMCMLYPGHPEEARMFRRVAHLIRDCHRAGIPVIVESLPSGLGRTDDYTPEKVSFAVRAAAEIGADVVKTAWPGDAGAFRDIVGACFVPVIVLGGAAANDDASVLTMVEQSVAAGGAGIAIGRNVWAHRNPAAILHRLRAIVHGNRTAAEAMALSPPAA